MDNLNSKIFPGVQLPDSTEPVKGATALRKTFYCMAGEALAGLAFFHCLFTVIGVNAFLFCPNAICTITLINALCAFCLLHAVATIAVTLPAYKKHKAAGIIGYGLDGLL